MVPLLNALVWELCKKYFCSVFSFCKIKVTVDENLSFIDYESEIELPDCSKFAKTWKNSNDVTIFRHDIIVKIFLSRFIFLVKFSYWSKFHDNIITGSGLMTFFFIRDWPEIWKSEIPSSEFSSILRGWVELEIPNLARISLMKSYWMLQKASISMMPGTGKISQNPWVGKIWVLPSIFHEMGKNIPIY